jgi:hypothetical protein
MDEALSMDAPALRKREQLVAVRLGAEKHVDLIKETTKPRGGGKGFIEVH